MDLLVEQETLTDLMSLMTVLDRLTGRAGDSNRFDVLNDCS